MYRITTFYQTLKIAILFQEYVIYFPWFLDFRGRAYSVGWPLHPQGNKLLARKLLQFDDSPMTEQDVHAQGIQL